jgi:hypothetical protein
MVMDRKSRFYLVKGRQKFYEIIFFVAVLFLYHAFPCLAEEQKQNGNIAVSSSLDNAQCEAAKEELIKAAKEIAQKTGNTSRVENFIKRISLCYPSGGGLASSDPNMRDNVCLTPLCASGFKMHKNEHNKINLSFYDPEMNSINFLYIKASNFQKGVAVLRTMFQYVSHEYRVSSWQNADAYCWSWMQSLNYEEEIYRMVGGSDFEKMLKGDVDALKQEVAGKNAAASKARERLRKYPEKLDLIFGKAMSEEEIFERTYTYYLIVNMNFFGNRYDEKFRFLREFYDSM